MNQVEKAVEKAMQAVTDRFKPKYFNNSKKGENYELKSELCGDTKDKRKEAVKRVIANMTVGKDVSPLFADVVKNMQTEDLELKKLVYLYLINYAKSNPELVILAVNTFIKDSDDPNPLIRALSIRTMGCIRVNKMVDYVTEPMKKALKDDHPYVRKTAAICVAKFFDLNPVMAIENGFVSAVQDMLSDQNPMVVANAVSALLEMNESSARKDVFLLNASLVNKLLVALNECTEWGQIGILDALVEYKPADSKEAEAITERVLPRLQHANAGVVLSAIKVLLLYLPLVENDDASKNILKKMSPPLVTLLSSPPEVQYVALRNMNLILQKKPDILTQEIRVFFCKYNDPPYVKLEKLEVMIRLASDKNVDQLISELKEYANEVDVDFVRKAVQAIGRCAIKIECAAERCVTALLELIKNKVNYVVQEAIIVIKDIFRKYPARYESIIPTLCENLESLDEPNAKASMIWIIGEYAERIENAQELIDYFLESFKYDSPAVQLQLLTATVKLFLKKPQQMQELVQKVLQTATTGESADLRDRAYIYWRLLSSDPQSTKAVVLAEKPPIANESSNLSDQLLNELVRELSTVASVYHKPASTFLIAKADFSTGDKGESDDEAAAGERNENDATTSAAVGDLLDLDFAPSAPASVPAIPSGGNANLLDILDDPAPVIASSPTSTSPVSGALSSGSSSSVLPPQSFLSAAQAKGLELNGTFARRSGTVYMDLTFTNKAMTPLYDFAVQFNKNSFGLVPASPIQLSGHLQPNQTMTFSLPLATNGPVQKMDPVNTLQVAIKNNVEVFYFQTFVPLHVLFAEDGLISDPSRFMSIFNDPAVQTIQFNVADPKSRSLDEVKSLWTRNNVFVAGQASATKLFVASKLVNGIPVLSEVNQTGPGAYTVVARSPIQDVLPLFQNAVETLFQV